VDWSCERETDRPHLVVNRSSEILYNRKFITAFISAFYALLRLSLVIINNISQTAQSHDVTLKLVISALQPSHYHFTKSHTVPVTGHVLGRAWHTKQDIIKMDFKEITCGLY
jgi:hypothetical protein